MPTAGSGAEGAPREWGPDIGAGDREEAWLIGTGGESDDGTHCGHSGDDGGDNDAERFRLQLERNHQEVPA